MWDQAMAILHLLRIHGIPWGEIAFFLKQSNLDNPDWWEAICAFYPMAPPWPEVRLMFQRLDIPLTEAGLKQAYRRWLMRNLKA